MVLLLFYDLLCLVVYFCILYTICATGTVGAPCILRDCAFPKYTRTGWLVRWVFFSLSFSTDLSHNFVPLEISIYSREQCFFALTLGYLWYLQYTLMLCAETHCAHLNVTSVWLS